MAINPSVKSLINRYRGEVFTCHQVPLTILRFLRSGKRELQDGVTSGGFARLMEQKRDAAKHYDVREAVPPNLYEVFGYFQSSGQLWHSSIVVDTSPEVILAECDTRLCKISLNPLKKSLAGEFAQIVYLYPKQVLNEILLVLPSYLQRMENLLFPL